MDLFPEDIWVLNPNEEKAFKPKARRMCMRELPFMKMIKRISTSLSKYVVFKFYLMNFWYHYSYDYTIVGCNISETKSNG